MDELLARYLQDGELNYVDLCRRVAKSIAQTPYDEAMYFESLIHKEFIPASLTLLTAGEKNPCLCSDIALPWSEREQARRALAHGLGVSLHIPDTETVEGVSKFLLSFKDVLQREFRPGATMLTCKDTHPELDTFIELKNTHREIAHVNFTVLCSKKDTLAKIAPAAHACGDPGFANVTLRTSPYLAPCGQSDLLPWQSVPYAHINLAAHVQNKQFDIPAFLETVSLVRKFLLRSLELHSFLNEQNKEVTQKNKKIGIGLLGLAELAEQLGVSCNAPELKKLLTFIATTLGSDGAISPTGATSRLLGVTPNIEPKLPLQTPIQDQLALATVVQEHIGGAISKTILLPESATVQEVEDVFDAAWNLNLKGLTVYRNNSLE